MLSRSEIDIYDTLHFIAITVVLINYLIALRSTTPSITSFVLHQRSIPSSSLRPL